MGRLNRLRRYQEQNGPYAFMPPGSRKLGNGVWMEKPPQIELRPWKGASGNLLPGYDPKPPKHKLPPGSKMVGAALRLKVAGKMQVYFIGPCFIVRRDIWSDEARLRGVLDDIARDAREAFGEQHKLDVPFYFLRQALQVKEAPAA